MRRYLLAISFFVWAFAGAQFGFPDALQANGQNSVIERKPEFFALDWKTGQVLTEKETPLSIEVDSMGRQGVAMLVDKELNPVLYTSNIETPVCADGDCRLMHIKLYWTLLGDYAGFDRHPGLPLTKHDHDEFLREDYLKLHLLLGDKLSILERRTIDELVVRPEQPEAEGADALSGATIAEVRESVVEGALYSCYVAWHLVHGAIKEEIKKHTLSMVDDYMLHSMLYSGSTDYQMFALDRLGKGRYEEFHQRIAEIFGTAVPMVRSVIIKGLPDSFWEREELQRPFWERFAKVDINSRSLLLDHIGTASQRTLVDISGQLGAMTKNQLKTYLAYLGERPTTNPRIMKNLENFARSDSQKYAYLVEQFLEDAVN